MHATSNVPRSEEPETVMPTFITRLSKLSLVESAVTKANALYQSYGKENSIQLVQQTCGVLEQQVAQLQQSAAKIAQQNNDKVAMLDDAVNAQLDRVEALYANVTSLRSTVASTVKQSETLNAVEQRVCDASSSVLTTADAFVDSVLPAEETDEDLPVDDGEAAEDSGTELEDGEAQTEAVLGYQAIKLLKNARKFSNKLQMRAYRHALKQLHQVQVRTDAAQQALKPYTVDLLAYARDHLDELADDKAVDVPEQELEEDLTTDPHASVTVKSDSILTNLAVTVDATRRRAIQQSARLARTALDTSLLASERAMHALQAGAVLVLETPTMAVAAAQDASEMTRRNVNQATTMTFRVVNDPKAVIYDAAVAANNYVTPIVARAETYTIVQRAEEAASHTYDYLLSYPQFRTVHDPIKSWTVNVLAWFKPASTYPHTPHTSPTMVDHPMTFAQAVKEGEEH